MEEFIKECFNKYLLSNLEEEVMGTICERIRWYRQNPSLVVEDYVPKAVTILYECKSDENDRKTAEFEVLAWMRSKA